MSDPLQRAGARIIVYEATDPSVPQSLRFVAHWFRDGALQVATAVGPTKECGERLKAALNAQIAKATKPRPEVDPAKSQRMRDVRAARTRRLPGEDD